jgi:hypothetical protein
MAYDYQLIITTVTILASGIAIIFSSYNFYQSIRKPEADLWIDEDDEVVISYIYNPGKRPIALIKFKYVINGKVSDIKEGHHPIDDKNLGSTYYTSYDKENKINFPSIIKGGGSAFIIHNAKNLSGTLSYKGYSDKIKLSIFFETAQKEKIMSKSINFDMEEYKINKSK